MKQHFKENSWLGIPSRIQRRLLGLVLSSLGVLAISTSIATAGEIAYLGLSEGVWQVWVVEDDGSGNQQVTRSSFDKVRVSWYPEGDELLVNGADGRLYRVDVETGEEVHIPTELKGFQDAVISPDGQQVAFSLSTSGSRDDNNIWVVDLETAELRKLTNMNWLQHEPVWGPDGDELFFLSGDGGQTHDIWRLSLSDGTSTQLTAHNAYHFDVDVSHAGEFVYSNNRDGSYDLWIDGPDSPERKLTDDPVLEARPSWAPDARRIVFESTRQGGLDLWLIDSETSEITRLTNSNGGARAPAWRN